MSDRSPGSSSSGYSSQTTSPYTTYLTPNSHGSSTRISVSYAVSHQQQGTQDYVSPYPALPATTPTNNATISATTVSSTALGGRPPLSSRASASSASASPSAVLSAARQQAQKQALIQSLNEHRTNTIGELRRVERVFATLGSSDLTQPMTAAWVYYVNSNSLLTELRGLTRNYPFSSECLDEAKRRVHGDPASNRSWNYCWLVLAKIHTDRLIPAYARAQAVRPEMWGGRIPLAESVAQLTEAFVKEWSAALAQMLKYWEEAPVR